MAFVVLCSTMSFTVNMHYCGDKLVETTVFKSLKGCGIDMQKSTPEDCVFNKKSCCEDKHLAVEGQDELQLQFNKISLEKQVFIASFVYAYINLFEGIDKDVSLYQDYKPPLVVRYIYKMDETYLI